MFAAHVVAEPVHLGFEHGEGFDIGLLLRRIGAARRERNLHAMAGILRRLLDRRAATENDQVGERHLLAAELRGVELLLDLLQLCQRNGQLAPVR